MKILVKRGKSTGVSTVSDVFVNGGFRCFALEDPVRKEKIYGQTAIPAGTYSVIVTFSPTFKRDLPLLLNVPGYEGVRIHPGNTAADTLGCILVGMTKGVDRVNNSVAAFLPLFAEIRSACLKGEPVTITLEDA